MMTHQQVLIKVNAEVDRGVAPLVQALNEIEGVITLDSCENGGNGWGAYVYFTYQKGWQALAGLLQAISSSLGTPGIACGYALRLEWLGSNENPRAQIACEPEHVGIVAEGIQKLAASRNAHTIESVDGR